MSLKHQSYGYRRIAALLKKERWSANHKKVYRLSIEESLSLKRRVKKKFAN
ncbi:IS3 family transposase [Candidatus Protochlamydia sp. W-9]|uniref:IS3 family transposase n=1 Tax=Candidatus Protochlamydia sp. W-9 TaxID=1785087 RepID=UPI0009AE2743